MAQSHGLHPTLIGTLWPGTAGRVLRFALLAVVGTALLALSAKIKVPFYPVEQTMQSYVVVVLAMTYGWRLGLATLLLYMAEGAAGLPVFTGTPERGLGLAYMAANTGGYLLGFVLAAGICGWLAERGWDRKVATAALAVLIGNVVIYVPGLLWLGALFGWDQPILEWGLYPFIYGDLAKMALAAVSLPVIWSLVKRG